MRGLGVAFCVLAACGDDGGNTKLDGGTTSDSGETDAPQGDVVTITVKSVTTPLAGVRVHFQNPDSTLITSALTDASGVASAVMPLGGYVTAVNPFADPFNPSDTVALRTFAGVKAGDALVLRNASDGDTSDTTITAPVDTDGAVTGYLIATPCDSRTVAKPSNGANPSAVMSLPIACLPSTDVLVVSLASGSVPVHWLYVPNVAVSANAIDLSAMAITGAPSTKMYTFNNVPAASGGVELAQFLAAAKGVVLKRGAVSLTGTAPTHSFALPPFPGALDLVEAVVVGGAAVHLIYDWAPYATTYTTDVGARLLAEPMTVASFDATAHQVKWTPGTSGVTPEFALSYVSASRPASSLTIDWRICAPYSGGVLQFPTLPVDGGNDYNIAASDTTSIGRVVLGKVTGGYDTVRASLLSLNDPQDLTAGTSTGSMTLERFGD